MNGALLNILKWLSNDLTPIDHGGKLTPFEILRFLLIGYIIIDHFGPWC